MSDPYAAIARPVGQDDPYAGIAAPLRAQAPQQPQRQSKNDLLSTTNDFLSKANNMLMFGGEPLYKGAAAAIGETLKGPQGQDMGAFGDRVGVVEFDEDAAGGVLFDTGG